MHGRAIRIFLVDGTPTGIRIVTVGNWTIKAVVAPRAQLGRLRERPEAGRAGVYFLLGEDPEQAGRLRIYVGESEDVVGRQDAHARQKEFWDTVVAFVSTDERLTKAHVRWLEAELIQRVADAKRATLDNSQRPETRRLPEADRAEMSEFLEQVMLVAEVLGLGVFPFAGWGSTIGGMNASARGAEGAVEVEPPTALFAEGRIYSAKAQVSNAGFVVVEGSTAAPETTVSLQKGYREIHGQLVADGVLTPNGHGSLTFTQDYLFRSSSAAAGVVAGSSRNGRLFWKLEDGRTLGEWEDSQAALEEDGEEEFDSA